MKKAVIILICLFCLFSFNLFASALESNKPIGGKDMFSIEKNGEIIDMIRQAVDEESFGMTKLFDEETGGNYRYNISDTIIVYSNGENFASNWREKGKNLNSYEDKYMVSYLIPVYGEVEIIGFIYINYSYYEKKYVADPIYALPQYIGWLNYFNTKEKTQTFANKNDLGKIRQELCFFSKDEGVTIYFETEIGEYTVSYNYSGLEKGKVYNLNEFIEKRCKFEKEIQSMKKTDEHGNLLYGGGQVKNKIYNSLNSISPWIIYSSVICGIWLIGIVVASFLIRRKKQKN